MLFSDLLRASSLRRLVMERLSFLLKIQLKSANWRTSLKMRGYHAEYTLNSEVLKISPIRLFELIIENVEHPNQEFNRIVQAHLEEAHDVGELIDDALTLKQKLENYAAKSWIRQC